MRWHYFDQLVWDGRRWLRNELPIFGEYYMRRVDPMQALIDSETAGVKGPSGRDDVINRCYYWDPMRGWVQCEWFGTVGIFTRR